MAPSTIRKALGAVKDRTSIGLAKVSSNGSVATELDVAIVKATRHDEFPAEERHVREILSLTCYSRAYVARCVAALSRRLGRTRSWAVALKTLVLVHRLLADGDPAFEQELFFATRRGTRILNLSDFRHAAWDFSAFVRTYALYLDQRLDYRMHARRRRRTASRGSTASLYRGDEEEAATAEDHDNVEGNADEGNADEGDAAAARGTPVREMKTERILVRTQHLQHLLERFLACRPTGAAKGNRIVAVALYPLVKESFQIYYDLSESMSALIDRFTDFDVSDCARVHDIFACLAKQLDELDAFYAWCKSTAICRPSEFPDVERITPRKLDLMDEFIRHKSAAAAQTSTLNLKPLSLEDQEEHENRPPEDDAYADMVNIRALPAPEEENHDEDNDVSSASALKAEAKVSSTAGEERGRENEREADLLNLEEDVMTGEEHGAKLALALFDGSTATAEEAAPRWEAFDEHSADWETALVQSASGLSDQKASLGGGLDMMLLDGMYSHAQASAAAATSVGYAGSASSVAIRVPPPQATMLALPAPPTAGGGDPFAASAMVAPPTYVQMSDMENKQVLLAEEQQMWQQYARDGMQGQMSLVRLQQQPPMAAALSRPPQNGAYYYHQNNMGGYNI